MCSCYRNKAKEESRQVKLEAFKETGVWPGMKSKVESKIAWSEKQDRKKKKLERIRKKDLKRANEEEVDNDEKEADDDEEDLEADYRLLKKIKRVSPSIAIHYFHLPDCVSSSFFAEKIQSDSRGFRSSN